MHTTQGVVPASTSCCKGGACSPKSGVVFNPPHSTSPKGRIRLGPAFRALEALRQRGDIVEFSISQPTLEQVTARPSLCLGFCCWIACALSACDVLPPPSLLALPSPHSLSAPTCPHTTSISQHLLTSATTSLPPPPSPSPLSPHLLTGGILTAHLSCQLPTSLIRRLSHRAQVFIWFARSQQDV